jgi:RimJ/RimL family protein N-acetyltransferase
MIDYRPLIIPQTLNESEFRIIRDKATKLIIGNFSYKRISDSEIEIEYLFIDEFRQRKGYGTETLASICRWADEEKIILRLNAQPVYQRNKIIVPRY